MKELGQADLSLRNTEEGIQRYVKTWYLLDQNYRKAVYYYQKSSEVTTLEPLREYIENHYTNSFLLTVNDNWQQVINTLDAWKFPHILQQQNFYHKIISRQHQQNRKAIVIISDALRYEVGEELKDKVKVVKLNVDENPETSKQYQISGIPTVIIFEKGEIKEKIVGFRMKQDYIDAINK